MDAELKAKWTAALRSGEFRQGRNALKSDDGRFCCLGVLCQIAGASWDTNEEGDRLALIDGRTVNRIGDEVLAGDFLGVVGFSDEQQRTLHQMNDGDALSKTPEHSFAEIADWIDANL